MQKQILFQNIEKMLLIRRNSWARQMQYERFIIKKKKIENEKHPKILPQIDASLYSGQVRTFVGLNIFFSRLFSSPIFPINLCCFLFNFSAKIIHEINFNYFLPNKNWIVFYAMAAAVRQMNGANLFDMRTDSSWAKQVACLCVVVSVAACVRIHVLTFYSKAYTYIHPSLIKCTVQFPAVCISVIALMIRLNKNFSH